MPVLFALLKQYIKNFIFFKICYKVMTKGADKYNIRNKKGFEFLRQ